MLSVGIHECRCVMCAQEPVWVWLHCMHPMDVLMQMCMFMGTVLVRVCVRVVIYAPTSSGCHLPTLPCSDPVLPAILPCSCCSLLVSPVSQPFKLHLLLLGLLPLLHHCSSVQVCTCVFLASS